MKNKLKDAYNYPDPADADDEDDDDQPGGIVPAAVYYSKIAEESLPGVSQAKLLETHPSQFSPNAVDIETANHTTAYSRHRSRPPNMPDSPDTGSGTTKAKRQRSDVVL